MLTKGRVSQNTDNQSKALMLTKGWMYPETMTTSLRPIADQRVGVSQNTDNQSKAHS